VLVTGEGPNLPLLLPAATDTASARRAGRQSRSPHAGAAPPGGRGRGHHRLDRASDTRAFGCCWVLSHSLPVAAVLAIPQAGYWSTGSQAQPAWVNRRLLLESVGNRLAEVHCSTLLTRCLV
jgi:hypothetical protein